MDGTTRLIVVGGAVALVVYFGWPYVRGELGEVGRQLSGDNRRTGFPPMWDPLGLMPGQGDTIARPDGRLRLPDGVGNAGDGRRDPRYAEPDDRTPVRPPTGGRQFRVCRIIGDRKECGPWQDGPAPAYGRR